MKSSNSSKSHPITLSGVHHLQIMPHLSGADPGFPVGGGANLQEGATIYNFANFFKKYHMKLRKFSAVGGGARGGVLPLDPPLLVTIDIDPGEI